MLILQGGRDYQVTTEDLDRWKAVFEKDPKLRIHQAYHAGQLGLLRRIAGKEGAIR